MAQTFRFPRALISAAVVLAIELIGPPASAQPAVPARPPSLRVVVPAGVSVPPGTYPGVVTVGGRRIALQIVAGDGEPQRAGDSATPSTAAAASPAPGGAPPSSSPPTPPESTAPQTPAPSSQTYPVWLIAIAATAPALIVGGVLWYYFRRAQPAKAMAELAAALSMVAAGHYDAALPRLTAIEGTLPPPQRREARFFVAFCHAMSKNYAEAILLAGSLHREASGDSQVAYLLGWLYATDKQYDAAERVLASVSPAADAGTSHAARLKSVVKFARATQAYRDGDIDVASERFAEVQKLGHFGDRIPGDLRDRHAALGATALFERRAAPARQHFQALSKAAKGMAGESGRTAAAKAAAGLALAAWLEGDGPEAAQTIESCLVEAAASLRPDEPMELAWPDTTPDRSAVEQLDKPAEAVDAKKLRLTLRDIHFLRGINVLRAWKTLSPEAARKEMPTRYKDALGRFACALEHDADWSPVYLVVGLLIYYLRTDVAERTRGIDLLARARALGMGDPETLEILRARDEWDKRNADARTRYLDVLDKYIGDETVRLEVRKEVLAHLARYRRFSGLDKPADLSSAQAVQPTVEDLRNRSQLLQLRVDEIINAGESIDASSLRTKVDAVDTASRQLLEQAHIVEDRQADLLTTTGDLLFRD